MPSSRLHPSAATFRDGSHASLRSVLRFSQPLDGFLRAPACRLISSRCHVQGLSPFRGFSPRAATLPRRKEPAPRPLSPATLTGLRRSPHDSALDFEALIRARPRSLPRGYSPRGTPLPSSGSSPPGPSLPTVGRSLPTTSALDVARCAFACALAHRPRPQRLSARSPADTSPLRPPARGFEPSLRTSVRSTSAPFGCPSVAFAARS